MIELFKRIAYHWVAWALIYSLPLVDRFVSDVYAWCVRADERARSLRSWGIGALRG